MTKKLTTLASDAPLDLSNPAIAKLIVENEVSNRVEPTEPLPAKPAVNKSGKLTSFTIQLTSEQVANLIRQADASGVSWKAYLEARIQEEILTGKIGKAVISQPSTMKAKITGYTGSVSRG